ncbi:L,D-transpeptidase [Xanthobacter sediminis]|uniref:L,D-transpeptidase n=1 Tax=Xanthobacter sediminis TaxID=3119926 RepID=UPI0037279427
MMHLKALSAAAIAVALVAAAPARADDRYDLFPFAKLFLASPSDVGVVSSSSPIPRQTVAFDGKYRPGTVVIRTSERRLYYVTAPGQAIRYGVGVGRDGFQWAGVKTVSAKREWPGWTPPAQMLKRRPDLPRYMPGGIDNPLGARAMYLGSSLYRIHGSNEPETIGQAVSSGCIRMTNDDVTDLYNRVKVGTTVYVQR